MTIEDFSVVVATSKHTPFAEEICNEMHESAKARGTGIARRSPDYVAQKMIDGKAVIAFHKDGRWAGFSYIETWGHGDYVANSGLIISPPFRKLGLAKAIKTKTFALSLHKFKGAKLFGLTTGLAVMKINSELGYVPVPYSELTEDDKFWKGCESCVNYPILDLKQRKNCLCTAMIFDPALQTPNVDCSKILSDYLNPEAEDKTPISEINPTEKHKFNLGLGKLKSIFPGNGGKNLFSKHPKQETRNSNDHAAAKEVAHIPSPAKKVIIKNTTNK